MFIEENVAQKFAVLLGRPTVVALCLLCMFFLRLSSVSTQTPLHPAAGEQAGLQPELGASSLLPVCRGLRRPVDPDGGGREPPHLQARPAHGRQRGPTDGASQR